MTQRVEDFLSYLPMFLSDFWPYDHLSQLAALFLNRHFGTCLCFVLSKNVWMLVNHELKDTKSGYLSSLSSSMRKGNPLELAADQASDDPLC